jgi:hypothetical protein
MLQVNCPGMPQAQEMRVVSESMSEQIVDMSDWGSDMFELEMDLSATKLRGVQSWGLSLRRDGSDGPTEFTEFSLSMSSLFNPHFDISFPPEGDAYTFYKEVVPFFQSSVHEPREETERRGLLRNFTIRLEVTDVSGQGANDMFVSPLDSQHKHIHINIHIHIHTYTYTYTQKHKHTNTNTYTNTNTHTQNSNCPDF